MRAVDRYFVDSNLLLYYVDPLDAGKQTRAAEWLEALWKTGAGCLSWQVLHEFYWNAVRKMGLEPARAREIVEDLVHWKPVDTTFGLIQKAWYWTDSAQVTHWDALILAAAQRSGARYLLSEDFQSNRYYDEILVLNPFDHAASDFEL
jgi:predicted nucleic acid-binding protein